MTLILKGWGLIDGQLIAIDGTKIRVKIVNTIVSQIKQGLDKKIEYADAQINAYFMAMENEDSATDEFKRKNSNVSESERTVYELKRKSWNEGLDRKA